MSSRPLPDQSDRDLALDVTASYIVQAPAGSGKTELLTLRYLKLLAISAQPEEVLAITFTRKAAGEMRERILGMLKWSANTRADALGHSSTLLQKRFEICQSVLKKDQERDWHILDNPSRLRVQTIDSFCFYLARQLPVLSGLGGNPVITEDIETCFAHAISNTLAVLEDDSSLAEDMAFLLGYLDNNIARVQTLLSSLLHNREQWLTHVLSIKASFPDARIYLQECLDELVRESINEVHAGLASHAAELVELINFMAANLAKEGNLAVANFQPLTALPGTDYSELDYWRLLVDLLVTRSDSWRQRVDKRSGFPAGDARDREFDALCKARKAQLGALRDRLKDNDDLLEALAYLRKLPNPAYESRHWEFLSALIRLLEYLSGQLLLSFRKFRVIDYSQTSAAARAALGSAEYPTDLALALDHKIQHILVDEFQDTSQLQLDILQQLTSGWQLDDGRTVFLVGDAMQSCYGFRNANVGIYLNVREHGLVNVNLNTLTLQANFRSQENIVAWVNTVFPTAFPGQANSSRGAVPYTKSSAVHPRLKGMGIATELICHDREQSIAGRNMEAQRVVEKIITLKKQDANASVAILVRYRSHLSQLIPKLRAANIKWQSTDIDKLVTLPVIEDLLSLTRAIVYQGDRVAWLAILRAPWCGLTIGDLHGIHTHAGANTIWWALQQHQNIAVLSAVAQDYLHGFVTVMSHILAAHRRLGLRDLVESAWQLLRGSSLAETSIELESIAQFFDLLELSETGAGIASMTEFTDKVKSAFIPAAAAAADANTIHLLTMHKAKGLEFDHVLLPGLANKGVSDSKSLLRWHERLNQQGQARLFIAALSESGSDEGLLYKLLQHEQQHKNKLEDTRLLYIAITRARKSVSLFGSLPRNSKGGVIPRSDSLLSRIWRELQNEPQGITELDLPPATAAADQQLTNAAISYPAITPIKRYTQALSLSTGEAKMMAEQGADMEAISLQSNTDDSTADSTQNKLLASLSGTLIHRALEANVKFKTGSLDHTSLSRLRDYWRLQLRSIVQDNRELEKAIDFIEESVCSSLQAQCSWIFDSALQDSEAELRLSSHENGRIRNFVVDRSFIDSEGTRWIIDYKSAPRDPKQSEQDFISSQIQLHSPQLRHYRKLFATMESAPIKTALYLTSISKLVELE